MASANASWFLCLTDLLRKPFGDSGGTILLNPLLEFTDRREPFEPDLGVRRVHELQERVDLERKHVSDVWCTTFSGGAHVTLAHYVCIAQVEELPVSKVRVPAMRAQVLYNCVDVERMRPRRLVPNGVPRVRVEPLVVQVRETGQYCGAPIHKDEGQAVSASFRPPGASRGVVTNRVRSRQLCRGPRRRGGRRCPARSERGEMRPDPLAWTFRQRR